VRERGDVLPRTRFLTIIGVTSIAFASTHWALASELPVYESPPVPVKTVRPIYPEYARDAQIRGKVILHVLVDEEGHVKNIKVVRAVRGLDDAAVDAVRQWIFTPARNKGAVTSGWIVVPVWLPLDACPPEVLEGARASVIARVGEAFFTENLSLDSAATAVIPGRLATRDGARQAHQPDQGVPFWSVAYKLRIPTKAWVEGTIHANVDTTGSAVAAHPVDGIGDCHNHPEQCAFSIDEQAARKIAKRAGLKDGMGPWTARFQWVVREESCYAWTISNVLPRGELLGEGDTAIIDANSGRILGIEHRDSQP
jgi:periplasmic protein TonB